MIDAQRSVYLNLIMLVFACLFFHIRCSTDMVMQHPASTSLVRAGVLISLLLATLSPLPPPTSGLSCENLEEDLLPSVEDSMTSTYQNATVRRVVTKEGQDTSACLNPGNESDPPSCATLPYALYGTAVPEVLAAIIYAYTGQAAALRLF